MKSIIKILSGVAILGTVIALALVLNPREAVAQYPYPDPKNMSEQERWEVVVQIMADHGTSISDIGVVTQACGKEHGYNTDGFKQCEANSGDPVLAWFYHYQFEN